MVLEPNSPPKIDPIYQVFMASSSTSTPPSLHGQVVTEKLTKTNHVLWKAQVLATLRGTQMACFLDTTTEAPTKTIIVTKGDKDTEKVPNSAYVQWLAQEQQVLSYLLISLS